MEYISSILNYAVSSVSHDHPKVPTDTITCFDFFPLQKNSSEHLHLALGYERGFEVWDFQNLSSPELLLSIRNSGIKKVIFSTIDPKGSLLLTSLYPTLDFPLSSFHVFSFTSCKVTKIINTQKDIETLQTSKKYIICATVSNSIEIFENYLRIFVLNPFINNIDSFRPVLALTNKILAYTFISKASSVVNLSGEIRNFASSSLESILGQSSLFYSSVYNKLNIMDIETNSKFQEIQPFEVSVNVIQFSQTGKLMFVCPEHGKSFQVYRLEDEYILVYTLYRGVSSALVVNANFSPDETSVVVTSNKGTCHLYTLDPHPKALLYNQQVIDRIKLNAVGCYYFNAQSFVILTRSGTVFVKTSRALQIVCQVSRPIDFKCKVPVTEELDAPVECYN